MSRQKTPKSPKHNSNGSGHTHADSHGHAHGLDAHSQSAFSHGTRFTREAGIGCSIVDTPEGIRVVQVTDGSPAYEKGIVRGDYLESVNRESVSRKKVLDVVAQIRGPFGTSVDICIRRGDTMIHLGPVDRGILVSLAQLNSRLRDLEDCIHRLACEDSEKAKLRHLLIGLSDANDLLIDQCNTLVQRAESAEQHLSEDVHIVIRKLQDQVRGYENRMEEMEVELKSRANQLSELQKKYRQLEQQENNEKERANSMSNQLKMKMKMMEQLEMQASQSSQMESALKDQLVKVVNDSNTKQREMEREIQELRKQLHDRDERLSEARNQLSEVGVNAAIAETLRGKADELLLEERWKEALGEYTAALNKAPGAATLDGRSCCYARLTCWDECFRDCQECLRLDPQRKIVRLRAVQCLLYLKKYYQAWEMLDLVGDGSDHPRWHEEIVLLSAAAAHAYGDPKAAQQTHSTANICYILLCWGHALSILGRSHGALALLQIARDCISQSDPAPCRAAVSRDLAAYESQILSIRHTPLHEAATFADESLGLVVLYGLSLSIDMNDDADATPLHAAVASTQPKSASFAKMLLDLRANVNAQNKEGHTGVHVAVQEESTEKCSLLLAYKADINAQNNVGFTPFHFAINLNCNHMAEWLMSKGADIHIKNKMNNTPLHTCILWDNVSLATELLRKGSDCNACGSDGWRPLHLTKSTAMASLLINSKANIEYPSKYGSSPLHLAVYNGDKDLASLLIHHGANVNSPNNWNDSPLKVALAKGDSEMSNLLMQHGATTEHSLSTTSMRLVFDPADNDASI